MNEGFITMLRDAIENSKKHNRKFRRCSFGLMLDDSGKWVPDPFGTSCLVGMAMVDKTTKHGSVKHDFETYYGLDADNIIAGFDSPYVYNDSPDEVRQLAAKASIALATSQVLQGV